MVTDWELRACRNDDPVHGLASLPDKSVGVVCCDPPYSEKVHACSRRSTLAFGPGANAERVRELGLLRLRTLSVYFAPRNLLVWRVGGFWFFVTTKGLTVGVLHFVRPGWSTCVRVLSDFTKPGELVCDPYAGSGTTGVACRALGRHFIGWESDTAMAAIARRRIAGDRAVPVDGQMEMF